MINAFGVVHKNLWRGESPEFYKETRKKGAQRTGGQKGAMTSTHELADYYAGMRAKEYASGVKEGIWPYKGKKIARHKGDKGKLVAYESGPGSRSVLDRNHAEPGHPLIKEKSRPILAMNRHETSNMRMLSRYFPNDTHPEITPGFGLTDPHKAVSPLKIPGVPERINASQKKRLKVVERNRVKHPRKSGKPGKAKISNSRISAGLKALKGIR
jgi:hypothetical protein